MDVKVLSGGDQSIVQVRGQLVEGLLGLFSDLAVRGLFKTGVLFLDWLCGPVQRKVRLPCRDVLRRVFVVFELGR